MNFGDFAKLNRRIDLLASDPRGGFSVRSGLRAGGKGGGDVAMEEITLSCERIAETLS